LDIPDIKLESVKEKHFFLKMTVRF